MHLLPLGVEVSIAFDRVLSVIIGPVLIILVLPVVVEFAGLGVVARVVLGVAVRVHIDGGPVVLVGASLPVHVNLLQLLDGLALPRVEGLVSRPGLSTPLLVVLVIAERKAILASESSVLELTSTVGEHVEIVLVVAGNARHEHRETDDSGLVGPGLLTYISSDFTWLKRELGHHLLHRDLIASRYKILL